jgi:hypothetical protein
MAVVVVRELGAVGHGTRGSQAVLDAVWGCYRGWVGTSQKILEGLKIRQQTVMRGAKVEITHI